MGFVGRVCFSNRPCMRGFLFRTSSLSLGCGGSVGLRRPNSKTRKKFPCLMYRFPKQQAWFSDRARGTYNLRTQIWNLIGTYPRPSIAFHAFPPILSSTSGKHLLCAWWGSSLSTAVSWRICITGTNFFSPTTFFALLLFPYQSPTEY